MLAAVNPGDLSILQECAEDVSTSPTLARRARIVLLREQGMAPTAVARLLGCTRQTVVTWLERYRADGIDGLRDAPRPGRPVRVNPAAVVVRTLQAPRGGHERWSTRRLAAEFGISNVMVGNIWRHWGIRPEPAGRVALLTEPVLDTAIIDVLGLFVSRSMIICAVAVGEPRKRRGAAIGLGRVASGRLLDLAAPDGPGDPLPAVEFFDQLEGLLRNPTSWDRRDDAGRSATVRLLVRGNEDLARRWARTRGGVVVHVIPSHLAWDQIVRVGCLIAGADEVGAASVHVLRAAITEAGDEGAFHWIQTADGSPHPS